MVQKALKKRSGPAPVLSKRANKPQKCKDETKSAVVRKLRKVCTTRQPSALTSAASRFHLSALYPLDNHYILQLQNTKVISTALIEGKIAGMVASNNENIRFVTPKEQTHKAKKGKR